MILKLWVFEEVALVEIQESLYGERMKKLKFWKLNLRLVDWKLKLELNELKSMELKLKLTRIEQNNSFDLFHVGLN